MSQRVFLLGVGVLLVAGALALTDWWLKPPPGVTEANFGHIRLGMPRRQVNALFGRPADRVWDSGVGYAWVWEEPNRKAVSCFRDDEAHEPRVVDAFFEPPSPGPCPPPAPFPGCAPGWAGEPKGVSRAATDVPHRAGPAPRGRGLPADGRAGL